MSCWDWPLVVSLTSAISFHVTFNVLRITAIYIYMRIRYNIYIYIYIYTYYIIYVTDFVHIHGERKMQHIYLLIYCCCLSYRFLTAVQGRHVVQDTSHPSVFPCVSPRGSGQSWALAASASRFARK